MIKYLQIIKYYINLSVNTYVYTYTYTYTYIIYIILQNDKYI